MQKIGIPTDVSVPPLDGNELAYMTTLLASILFFPFSPASVTNEPSLESMPLRWMHIPAFDSFYPPFCFGFYFRYSASVLDAILSVFATGIHVMFNKRPANHFSHFFFSPLFIRCPTPSLLIFISLRLEVASIYFVFLGRLISISTDNMRVTLR